MVILKDFLTNPVIFWDDIVLCHFDTLLKRIKRRTIKNHKMVQFGEFMKTWRLWSKSVTRLTILNWRKTGEKCQKFKLECDILGHFQTLCITSLLILNETFFAIFNQCANATLINLKRQWVWPQRKPMELHKWLSTLWSSWSNTKHELF